MLNYSPLSLSNENDITSLWNGKLLRILQYFNFETNIFLIAISQDNFELNQSLILLLESIKQKKKQESQNISTNLQQLKQYLENKRMEFNNWIKLLMNLSPSSSLYLSNIFNVEFNQQIRENNSFIEILNMKTNLCELLNLINSQKELYLTLFEELLTKYSSLIQSNSNLNSTIIPCLHFIQSNHNIDNLTNEEIDIREITILFMNDLDDWMCSTIINLSKLVSQKNIPKSLEKIHQIRYIGIESLLQVSRSQSIDSNVRFR